MKKWEKHKRNTCFFCFHPLVSPLNGKVWLRVEEVGIRWDGVWCRGRSRVRWIGKRQGNMVVCVLFWFSTLGFRVLPSQPASLSCFCALKLPPNPHPAQLKNEDPVCAMFVHAGVLHGVKAGESVWEACTLLLCAFSLGLFHALFGGILMVFVHCGLVFFVAGTNAVQRRWHCNRLWRYPWRSSRAQKHAVYWKGGWLRHRKGHVEGCISNLNPNRP